MNIVIAGAGELGLMLAEKLTENGHDVVLIDSSVDTLEHINDSLDVKLLEGSCADRHILERANIRNADVLLAVSGDEASNILACQLAARLGTRKTICRMNGSSFFAEQEQLTPESFGIWKHISPPDECVRKIMAVLEDKYLLEEIRFSHPDAVMRVFEITPSSLISGTRIKDIPMDSALLASIRFAAIARGKQFVIPHGDTLFVPGDRVYIAGTSEHVRDFIRWVSDDQAAPQASRIIIAGATVTGTMLAQSLARKGYDIRVIERSRHAGEKLSDVLPANVLVINGDPTDEDVQREAGVAQCGAFIGATPDDENNILSCIIAKQQGAGKTISLTAKPEYIRIVPVMDMIDCGISSTLVAVNSILRMLETGTMRVDAYMQMYHAQLTEFRVSGSSPLCGRALASCKLPASTLFALLFRGGEVSAPSGGTVLQPGDVVVAIVTPEMEKELAPLFPVR